MLIYRGMFGRGLAPLLASTKSKHGLVTCLNSHASGRFSGDQFCVYAANRLFIPKFVTAQRTAFATVELTLDQMTKQYIRERLNFQFTTTSTVDEACAREAECREGISFGSAPALNPLLRDEKSSA